MRRACLLIMAAALLLPGCKQAGGPGATPEATFAAFDAAMQAGNFSEAAALIDFDALAKAANPDWDSIPPGQQREITKKMREDAAGRLKSMGYPSAGLTVSGTVENGAQAKLAAAGGSLTLKLGLAQTEVGWQIVSGLPTMTTP